MPDLFSWTIYMFYALLKGDFKGKPNLKKIPKWTMTLYGITHSIFVFAATILIIFLIIGKIPTYLWA
jgi:hypothetical protein